jgi:hypothetical protein
MKRELIARATGHDGAPYAEASVIFDDCLPHYEDHRRAEDAITELFRSAFGHRPTHVASATLPFIDREDD